MAVDSGQIHSGLTGNVYVAPVGTALPTNTETALNAAFLDVGHITTDGVTLTPGIETAAWQSWQSRQDVKRIKVSESFEVSFTMMQLNRVNWTLALGGGSWAETGVGTDVWKFTPPDASSLDERAMVIQYEEGSIITRFVFEKGTISDLSEFTLRRDELILLPVTYAVLATDDDASWFILSDDPELDA